MVIFLWPVGKKSTELFMLGSDENSNNHLHKQAWNRHQKVILNTDSLPVGEESLNSNCEKFALIKKTLEMC